ncbi:MAG: permease [FCB group bacterium]|nr:permease [FCB group bacterium]
MELILNILREFWGVLAEMSPYLIFGFLIAGILSVFISSRMIEKHLGGRGILPVLKSALFGIPLPLCSCGVIPVGASLKKSGASRGAATAFLISTPQTGVDSIMVTFSLLGPVYAVFRPIAALITGVIGGGLGDAFEGNGEGSAKTAKKTKIQEEHGSKL